MVQYQSVVTYESLDIHVLRLSVTQTLPGQEGILRRQLCSQKG